MKTYPKGSRMIIASPSNLQSHLDVMVDPGKFDDEKIQGFSHAFSKGRYVKSPTEYALNSTVQDGEERVGLSLPDGYVYPPAVADIPAWHPKLEIEDGRSLWSYAKSTKLKELVVVLTPHTEVHEVVKEGARGNRPEGGIRRSQQSKQDIRKTVEYLFHELKMKRDEINAYLSPIYTGQEVFFRNILAQVWSSHYTSLVAAAVIQVRAGDGTIEEIAKLRGVTVFAIKKALQTKGPRKTEDTFAKSRFGRFVDRPVGECQKNLKNLVGKVGRGIRKGEIDFKYADDGLKRVEARIVDLLGLVKSVRDDLQNEFGPQVRTARGTAAGK